MPRNAQTIDKSVYTVLVDGVSTDALLLSVVVECVHTVMLHPWTCIYT